ncbi:hypothetical protein FF38_02037 [Lucilia cuprina]|uniref:Uncharacterized protein n=1 Tax=Lucilia cuprina TaxID=7375 RepID=A0A0L0BLQ0_LUCCU|nr:hypothetical protein FF38_02037 [Lucilia cuprina]
MKYLCCLWLCIVWLVCYAQYGVFGLHVQQAPEIIQRITRQATRYGSGGSVSGSNYRPVSGSSSNFNVRNIASDITTHQLNSVNANSGQRPVGVGAYSFGGMASSRPTNGNSFAISSSSIKGSGLRGSQPTNIASTIVGSGSVAGGSITAGRPQHLQQALLQAAQYQLQQQQQQQQQQLRRQIPQQQLYRQRPANTYQQYN